MNKFNKCKQSLIPGDLTSSDELSKCTRVHHLIFLNPPCYRLTIFGDRLVRLPLDPPLVHDGVFLLWRCILPPNCSVCIGKETMWQYASYPLDRSGPAAPQSFLTSACPSWVLTAYEPSTVTRADYPATWYSRPEKAGMIA